MKTNQVKLWKKILISAFALFGLGILIFSSCLIWVAVEKKIHYNTYYHATTINDSLQLREYHQRNKDYVLIYNKNTQQVVSPKMRWVSLGVNEGDSLTAYCNLKGRRGFINIHTGKIVIDGRYDRAWNFSEGLAAVCLDMKIGFINPAGEEVIPCKYPTSDYVLARRGYMFYGGHSLVTSSNNKCGLINQQGELVVDTIYDCIWAPSDCGLRVVQNDGKYGAMNLSGNIALPVQYDYITCDGSRLFATKNGIRSQIDTTGEVIKPFTSSYCFTPMYLVTDEMHEYPTGYFKYYAAGLEGVVDSLGNMVIPALYHQIRMLDEQLFEGEYDWDLCNEGGAWITIQL
jgi:hypothetical protein